MRLTMGTRDEILRTMAEAYKKATKKEKGRMFDHVKVVKHYDKPKTPYQRLLEYSCVDETTKEALRQACETLNPADLKRRIDRFKRKLEQCHKKKNESRKAVDREPSFV